MTTLKFSMTKTILAAGFFILTGTYGAKTVQAQIYVLQGEKGDTGAQGPAGPGFDQTTLSYVKDLQDIVAVDVPNNTLELKPKTGNKVTLKVGNNTLDFDGDTITVTTKTFEAKGTNGTSIKLDDDARSIKLTATQKNSSATATFSLEGGDANTTPKPNTQYPLAIFDSTNVQIQSGSTTTTGTVNGLGNLFIGYNEQRSSGNERGGSHNLIIGEQNNFKSYSGIVQGSGNAVTAENAAVIGGSINKATAKNAAVIGGSSNESTMENAAVIGGSTNKATDKNAAVIGGSSNESTAKNAAIIGGSNNATNTSGAVVIGTVGEILRCLVGNPQPICFK